MTYNVWNPWDPLKKVVLGNIYQPDFFGEIKNQKIKSALMQISEETHQDLDAFETTLKQFGCEVIRPDIDPRDSILNYVSDDDGTLNGVVPKGPLQPRDGQVVIGNELFITDFGYHNPAQLKQMFFEKENTTHLKWPFVGSPITEKFFNDRCNNGTDWPTYQEYLDSFYSGAPYSHSLYVEKEIEFMHRINDRSAVESNFIAPGASITVVGKDLYVNVYNNPYECEKQTDQVLQWFKEKYNDFRINIINVDGHSDGSFNLLKPGAIVTIPEVQDYNKTFPDWDVFVIEQDKGKFQIPKFWNNKKDLYGKWWVPGQEDNDEFNAFVQRWLREWVGYVKESVFDLNILMLDEHHVCVSSLKNKKFLDFLKKHRIEPVLVPWRHRFFWDGGLHCITLDLIREGTQQDYFPDRLEPVFDKGYDKHEI